MEIRRYKVDEFGHAFPVSDRSPDQGSGDYWTGLRVRHAEAGRVAGRAASQMPKALATNEVRGDQASSQDSPAGTSVVQ